MPSVDESQPDPQERLRGRGRFKIETLIRMARNRVYRLEHKMVTGGEAYAVREQVSALYWALEELGFPPSTHEGIVPSREAPRPAQPSTDDSAVAYGLVGGDIARSTHPRHRGRLYQIEGVSITGPSSGPGQRVEVWGRRISQATGKPNGPLHLITWPLEKVAESGCWVPPEAPAREKKPRPVFEFRDVVEDARRCPKAAVPGRWVISRAMSGPRDKHLHLGYRIREVGSDRRIVGVETNITWPVRKVGVWEGDLWEALQPPVLPGLIRTPRETYAVGDLVESVPKREPRPGAPKPPLYVITRMGPQGLSGGVRYGRKVLRANGRVTGREVQIYWSVRKVDPAELGDTWPGIVDNQSLTKEDV